MGQLFFLLLTLLCLFIRGDAYFRRCGASCTRQCPTKPRSVLDSSIYLRICGSSRWQSSSGRLQSALVVQPQADKSPVRPGLHLRLKGKILNAWGVLYGISLSMMAVCMLPIMYASCLLADIAGDFKRRRVLDWLIHIWARSSLTVAHLFLPWGPQLLGAENLPPPSETVVYVPNHSNFFDILILSGYVPRPFKYLSKAEILRIPLVGLGMQLARHVFLRRQDPESTLQCAQTVTQRLRDGSSMTLFAEGTRSADGRLKRFKKGAFQMAQTAGVRVVPVSIGNLHRLMPSQALLPLGPMRDAYVRIHPPIETQGRTVKEIKEACFEAVNAGLPLHQQYVPPSGGSSNSGGAVDIGDD